jgi:hypothetical protein
MDRIPVNSTNIAAVGYDSEAQLLEVEFVNGGVYQYFNVGQHVYDEFMNSSSKGSYHANFIKKLHACSRVG